MYEAFYGLGAAPFKLTPDGRVFYASRSHSHANAHLAYGLSQGEGFIVVTGEVGAGKTTLIQRLCQGLDPARHLIARVTTTSLSGDELLRLVMAGFGVVPGPDKAAMLLALQAALRHQNRAARRCLLVIDEAQNLPIAALEELRMLSNLTDDGSASLQTILAGQPQFRRTLASPDLDQLRQRVLVSCHLTPLEPAETRAYVEHRLRAAGWQERPRIAPEAFAAVHRHSDGVPRRINRLCGRVLLHAALDQAEAIDQAMVETVAGELRDDLEGAGPPVESAPADVAPIERLYSPPPVAMPLAAMPPAATPSEVTSFRAAPVGAAPVGAAPVGAAPPETLFRRLRHAFGGRA